MKEFDTTITLLLTTLSLLRKRENYQKKSINNYQ